MSAAVLAAFSIAATGDDPAVVRAFDPTLGARTHDLHAPSLATPDYVALWDRHGENRVQSERMRRHGDWIARDTLGRDGSTHVHVPSALVISHSVARFSIDARRVRPEANGDDLPYATDRTDIVAGQPCRYWDVYRRSLNGAVSFRRMSCLTDDGVELAAYIQGRNDADFRMSGIATAFERIEVRAEDVAPPAFDLAGWLEGSTTSSDLAGGDFTVTLSPDRSGGAHESGVTVRRRSGWTGERLIRRDGNASTEARSHDQVHHVYFFADASGAPERLMFARATLPHTPDHGRPIARDAEIILGEKCWWMFPSSMVLHDGGRTECRTADGIPLKITLHGRAAYSETFIATALVRESGALEDLLPPPALFDLSAWGVR